MNTAVLSKRSAGVSPRAKARIAACGSSWSG